MINPLLASVPSQSRDLSIASSPQSTAPKSEKYYYKEIASAKRRLFQCITASFRMEHSYRSKMGELRKKSLTRERREELERITSEIYRNCRKKDLEFEYLKDLVKELDNERAALYGSRKEF